MNNTLTSHIDSPYQDAVSDIMAIALIIVHNAQEKARDICRARSVSSDFEKSSDAALGALYLLTGYDEDFVFALAQKLTGKSYITLVASDSQCSKDESDT